MKKDIEVTIDLLDKNDINTFVISNKEPGVRIIPVIGKNLEAFRQKSKSLRSAQKSDRLGHVDLAQSKNYMKNEVMPQQEEPKSERNALPTDVTKLPGLPRVIPGVSPILKEPAYRPSNFFPMDIKKLPLDLGFKSKF